MTRVYLDQEAAGELKLARLLRLDSRKEARFASGIILQIESEFN